MYPCQQLPARQPSNRRSATREKAQRQLGQVTAKLGQLPHPGGGHLVDAASRRGDEIVGHCGNQGTGLA